MSAAEKDVVDFDVVVIGAGPVGGFVAGAVAERGHRVALAGALSPRASSTWSPGRRRS